MNLLGHKSPDALIAELLPHDSTAPARARAVVWEIAGLSPAAQDAAQIASELTANAVLYGQPPVLLQVSREHRFLRIEISQTEISQREMPQSKIPHAESVRSECSQGAGPGWNAQPVIRADRFGLQLVAALSNTWGTSLDCEGGDTGSVRRTVWAQIDESQSSGPSSTSVGRPSHG